MYRRCWWRNKVKIINIIHGKLEYLGTKVLNNFINLSFPIVYKETSFLVISLTGALNMYAAFDNTSDGFYMIIVNENSF